MPFNPSDVILDKVSYEFLPAERNAKLDPDAALAVYLVTDKINKVIAKAELGEDVAADKLAEEYGFFDVVGAIEKQRELNSFDEEEGGIKAVFVSKITANVWLRLENNSGKDIVTDLGEVIPAGGDKFCLLPKEQGINFKSKTIHYVQSDERLRFAMASKYNSQDKLQEIVNKLGLKFADGSDVVVNKEEQRFI
jgi:regulator of replication initiation timing